MSEKNDSNFLEQYYLGHATGDAGYMEEALRYSEVPDEIQRELPYDPEMAAIFKDPRDERAKYKIEIRLSANRSISSMVARIDFWLSGRMLAGGGDDHMFICGYSDCHSPIPSENVGQAISMKALGKLTGHYMMHGLQGHWSICPTCMAAGRNNNGRQATSIEAMGYHLNRDSNKLEKKTNHTVITDPLTKIKYPCVSDCILVSASPEVIASLLAKYWMKLDGNADLYMKYHPVNIKHQQAAGYFNHERPVWDEADQLVVYPLKNIIQDTSAGASLVGRFRALLLA